MATSTVRRDHDVDSSLRWVFDWAAFVTADGETIASALVESPAGISVVATTVGASTVTVTISGGTEGTTYDIVNRIVTSGGQKEDKVLQLTGVQTPSASHLFVAETGQKSSTATSYASVAQGDTYHASHLYAATWLQANTAQREKALMMATRVLDENVRWKGTKTSDDQALQWPRFGVSDRGGFVVQSDEMPGDLVNATCEMARLLLASDRTAEEDTRGFTRIKAGSVELDIDKADRTDIIPKTVARMVTPLGVVIGGGQLRLVRT